MGRPLQVAPGSAGSAGNPPNWWLELPPDASRLDDHDVLTSLGPAHEVQLLGKCHSWLAEHLTRA